MEVLSATSISIVPFHIINLIAVCYSLIIYEVRLLLSRKSKPHCAPAGGIAPFPPPARSHATYSLLRPISPFRAVLSLDHKRKTNLVFVQATCSGCFTNLMGVSDINCLGNNVIPCLKAA